MEQLHAFDCHQNVAEPQATENHIKYTHVVHRNCKSGLVIMYNMLHTGWSNTGCRLWRWHGQMQHSSQLLYIR